MFKRLLYLIFFILIYYISVFGILQVLEVYFNYKTGNTYFDSIGDETSAEKTRHLELQKRSATRSDNLLIYGSCEIEEDDISVNFTNKNNGFQVNKIGVGGAQSIIHAMSLGAFDQDITNKKIVFIETENFFKEGGIKTEYIKKNFSKIKYYSFLFNTRLSDSLKKRLAKRFIVVSNGKMIDYNLELFYAKIYSSEYKISKILSTMVHPFYYLYYKLLIVQDKYIAYQKLSEYRKKKMPEIIKPVIKEHDWASEKLLAIEKEKAISHNEFCIRDEKVDKMYARLQDIHFKYPSDSPEREDFLILLEVCKELKVRPLIIFFPNHKRIFDYYIKKLMFVSSDKQRKEFQKWFSDAVKSYGFELADFSEFESVDYFNAEYSHPGSLGLSYINESISKFYNKN
jgi:D-alanine transfer protein